MTPRPLGDASVLVTSTITNRVRALAARVGTNEARRLLHVSDATWAAARDHGRLKAATVERLVSSLDRIENEMSKGEAAE